MEEPLVEKCSISLNSRKTAEDWKTVHVTHLFKKEEDKKTKSYRPLSLTTMGDKMLESINQRGNIALFRKTENN